MPNDRYSGVMGRVLIVLALGFLAGLVVPAACHGQAQQVGIAPAHSPVSATDGTTTTRDTIPPILSDSARAAQSATLDSLFVKMDSLRVKIDSILVVRRVGGPTVLMEPMVEINWRTRSYAGAILLGLTANEFLKLDQDPCANGARLCFHTAYHDSFTTRDKLDHFSAAYFLTNSASQFGVPKWAAFGLTCGLAGPGFEMTQGAVSWKDIVADCAGSATSLGLQSLLRKMHDAGWMR